MGMYRLKDRIGMGGMGEVWKAEHALLARPAAIKLIRPEALTSNNGNDLKSIIPRFKKEAQITANLRSPHTIELYDFGVTDNGVFYYVMEFLDGLDLETLVERFGPQPAERVVHLMYQSAESLSEAHHNGLVHRDIKPSNLYISRMGIRADFLKVLDFGLVKSLDAEASGETKLTAEGTTTGTPAFMAPEMALGKGGVDGRSDIYALGCVAYWLLTGELVFQGETPMEIVVNHVKTEPTPPSQRTELPIPEYLEKTIMSCLAKDPEQRPQSMDQLSLMLDECAVAMKWTQAKAAEWWDSHFPPQQVDSVRLQS
jgi:serine/threonine-protein kinase